LADLNDYDAFNKVYETYFNADEAPARAAFQVVKLPKGARAEVKCSAIKEPNESEFMNLDTELDYYHSDGRTDFVGHRNTRTHIKDVSMGAGSSTSFGLMNLRDRKDRHERDLQNLMVNCAVYGTHPMCAKFG
jgi:hypothetical protein